MGKDGLGFVSRRARAKRGKGKFLLPRNAFSQLKMTAEKEGGLHRSEGKEHFPLSEKKTGTEGLGDVPWTH